MNKFVKFDIGRNFESFQDKRNSDRRYSLQSNRYNELSMREDIPLKGRD
jgi:hypothetical protein